MNNTYKIIAGIAICGAMITCKQDTRVLPHDKKVSDLLKAEWLLGKWENNSEHGKLSETWTRKNDSVFDGRTYFIAGKDTLFSEAIELADKNGRLVYTATISTQNLGKPVSFPASGASPDQLVFENIQHDFPKKIVYSKISADSLVAEISGFKDGKPASERFPMGKVKTGISK